MVAPHTAAKRKHTAGDEGQQSEASSSRSGLGGIGVGVGAGRVTRRSAAAALGPSSGGVSAPGIPSSNRVSILNSQNDGKPEADSKSWEGQSEAGPSGVQGSPESRKPNVRLKWRLYWLRFYTVHGRGEAESCRNARGNLRPIRHLSAQIPSSKAHHRLLSPVFPHQQKK